MTVSGPFPEEIEAGQKAYQRILAFERARKPIIPGGVAWLLPILAWYTSNWWGVAFWVTVILAIIWERERETRTIKQDGEFLARLEWLYGPAIYKEIKKEPRSLYYYLFQKRYWPEGRRPVAIALP